MKNGYEVTMLDASAEMCKHAEALTGQRVLHKKFEEINIEKQFDGIWACASLLHVSEKKLGNILIKFWCALKDNGILYASWKYGETEWNDGQRFYCGMTEEKIKNILVNINRFDCLECWISEDVLPANRKQKWLNVILCKTTFPKNH